MKGEIEVDVLGALNALNCEILDGVGSLRGRRNVAIEDMGIRRCGCRLRRWGVYLRWWCLWGKLMGECYQSSVGLGGSDGTPAGPQRETNGQLVPVYDSRVMQKIVD